MALLNTNIGPERVQVFPQAVGVVPVPGVPTSVTAFIISSTLGPTNTPTSLTNLDTFVSQFGGPVEAGQGYYAVEDFFNNGGTGNTAIIVNVGTSPTSSDYIGTASDGKGLRALDPIDTVGLVCIPGLPMTMAYLVQPALIDYTETVRAEFGATLSTSFSLLSIPTEVTKANNSVLVKGPYTISSIAGTTLQFPASTDLAGVTAGMIVKKAGVFKAIISSVNDALDQVTVVSLGGLVATDSVTLEIASAVEWKDNVINNPSKAAAWYFNWVVQLDEDPAASPGDTLNIDPVGAVAGVMARIDANTGIGGVSHAPAGISYAGIAGIVGLQLSLSERSDAEPLRLAFINRITSFPGSGNVIFGGYSAAGSAATSDEQLVQVIRAIQFIKGSLERGLRGFLWENFSPVVQEKVEQSIASFLRNNSYLFPAGLPENQQFKVVHVEATQDDIDAGLLKVRVLVKPNKAIRFIEVALEFPLPTA